ncbi:MAG: FAD/NAD(P)-binding protein [Bacteroidota bacterium]
MNRDEAPLDLLIVGGGIQGMYLFHLIKQKRGDLNIKIADPHSAPLHNWKHCSENSGMKFLRSPGVHHLDIEPLALQMFCKYHSSPVKPFTEPNNRPSLFHFNSHSEDVIGQYNISEHWIQAQIDDIELSDRGVQVHLENERIWAKHVLLAIGSGEQLNVPEWATALTAQAFPVHHIYSSGFSINDFKPGFHTIVIGNGMGAVQAFVKLAETHAGKITLLTPHELAVEQYDIEPGWMGPRYLNKFRQAEGFEERRSMINSARKRGTITPDVNWELKQILNKEHASHVVGRVTATELFGSDSICLNLSDDSSLLCDQVLLGTGFNPVVQSELMQKLSSKPELRCAGCGYPIVDPFLRWHPNLIVTGELAELELGPAAKNIIGARHAGERIQYLF